MISAPEIPGYSVAGVLGSGGFATVYQAWQVAVGREVAVKVDNRVLLSERDQRRFVREVTAAGRLSGHPHVVDVYDAGMLRDGRPFMVMELCPAGSLNDALRRNGPMSAGQVRDIGIRIADALAAAHAAGILHRDIKPGNILINRYGVVGLADFGLASILAADSEQSVTREALTPAFAPPESFRWEEPTPAADVYSLTATLYALLAGRPPRYPADSTSPSIAAIMRLHDQPAEEIPEIPAGLMDVLRYGLESDPAARLPSAAALRDALIALPARPTRLRPAGPPIRPVDPAQASRASYPGPPSRAGSAGPPSQPGYAGPPSRPGPAGPGRDDADTASARSGRHSARAARLDATAPGSRARRSGRLRVALAAGVVLLLGGGVFIGTQLVSGAAAAPGSGGATSRGTATGSGSPSGAGQQTIPATASGCPASSIKNAGALCPTSPECWNGMVVTAGSAVAASLACSDPHVWQTFAVGLLPASVRTYSQQQVAADPAIRAVCSMRILLKSRLGPARQIPAAQWEVEVMPPDEAAYLAGARGYRCVAHQLGALDHTSSQFGA